MWNINAQQGRIPCAIFTRFTDMVPRFFYFVTSCDSQLIIKENDDDEDAFAVKTSLYLLEGLWSYGGFKLTGSG